MSILSQFEKDQLAEITSISANKAATALSKMAGGRKVVIQPIQTPEIFIDDAQKLPVFVGGSQGIETSVLTKLGNDMPGVMILSFSPRHALLLASLFTQGHKKQSPVLDDFGRSALCETGNVLAGAVISSLYQFLKLDISQSVPDIATDMLGSIIESVAVEIGENSDIIIAFRVRFDIKTNGEENISGQLFFMFEPKASVKILETLKNKYPALSYQPMQCAN
ncbi:MAG: chemotaxis protein CheC [Candidatus Pacebacteria bacterium]|nr:chemotaxis protein CheC [Candidatus Paceibacterota bacterium]